jgi:hypothetical protein
MPHYIVEREVGPITREHIEEASRRSIGVIAEMEGVVWIRSYVSEAEGKINCDKEAPRPEAVLEHARRAGFREDRISEISLTVEPAMFR